MFTILFSHNFVRGWSLVDRYFYQKSHFFINQNDASYAFFTQCQPLNTELA